MEITRSGFLRLLKPFSAVFMAAIGVIALYSAAAAGEESILIIRSPGTNFDDAAKGIVEELGDNVVVNQVLMNTTITSDSIQSVIARYSPKMVVLMDNKAINIFKEYQWNLPDSAVVIPSISLMAVMIEKAIEGMKNAVGISYEIPIVTSAVNLRAVVKKPMRKIGVIYREFMSDFVCRNAEYCRKEGIELVPVVLPNKSFFGYSFRISNGLKKLFCKEKVDALWIPNDNALLKSGLITDEWAPAINKYEKPAIVGVEALVDPRLNMGTFAVLPDHRSLGNQAAGFILEVKDNGWRIKEQNEPNEHNVVPVNKNCKICHFKRSENTFTMRSGQELTSMNCPHDRNGNFRTDAKIFPPISVHKVVNAVQMKKFFNLDSKNIENVDKIMQ